MRVVVHDKLGHPQRVQATRVIVEDDFGNPIGVFIQIQPGHVMAELADDQDKFNNFLRMTGVDRTLVVDKVERQA